MPRSARSAPSSVKALLLIEHHEYGNEGYNIWVREYQFQYRITRVLEKRYFYLNAEKQVRDGKCTGLNKNNWIKVMEKSREIEALLNATPTGDSSKL